MRLLVCTKRDLHGARLLNRLLPSLTGHELVGVWLSDKQRPAEAELPELAELACLERHLPVDLLFALVDALPPALADTAPAASFHGLARRHGVNLSVFDELPDAATRLAALAPDLVIVARFSHLFDAASIATRTVFRLRDRWLMLYEGVAPDLYRGIGLAESRDGLSWRKLRGAEPNGSAFAHAPRGSGLWDARGLGCPSVVVMPDGGLRMYYIGSNELPPGAEGELATVHQIGLAVSADGDPASWRRWNA